MNYQSINKILIGAMFFFLFAVYLRTLKPATSSGDTAELACAGATLGIAHSPGYPLFTVLGRMGESLIPFSNSAYRINLLSLLEAFLSLLLMAFLFGSKNIAAVCVATGMLVLTPIFWKESIIAEVFSLNFLFAVILVFFMCRDLKAGSEDMKKMYLVSFLAGLFLGNHHTLLLFAPGVLYYFFLKTKTFKRAEIIRILGLSVVFFLLGLTIYLYLPVRSFAQPLLDWEDPQTWDRFWGVVTRSRYGTLSLAQGTPRGITPATIMEEMLFYGSVFLKNCGIAGAAVLILGAAGCYAKEKKIFVLCSLIFFFSGPFMFIWANVSHTIHTEYIMERFFLASLAPAAVIIGFGMTGLNKFGGMRVLIGSSAVVLAVCGLAVSKQAEFKQNRYTLQVYDAGKNVFRHLPRGSLLFADRADETEFSLAYLQYAAGFRKDVEYIDCNAGVSRSIYGGDYYDIWGKKRLAARDLVEQEKINDFDGPVYYATLLPEQTVTPKAREGILFITKGRRMPKIWPSVLVPPRGETKGDGREQKFYYNYYEELAQYFLDMKEPELAGEYYRKHLSSGGNWSKWGLNVAYELYNRKLFGITERFYAEYLRRFPENMQAWNNLGAVYNETNRLDEAENAFNKALKLDVDYADVYYNLAVVAWKRKNFKEAERLLLTALQKNPAQSSAKSLLKRIKGSNVLD